ncbi:MAG: YIP1 family protein [Marinosulfonomonas sp.]|nr:YIP1 family protein [Marinosulfonomonas sp.]
MEIAGDIIRSWRSPRRVMRKHLAAGLREDRALICLFAACVLILVSQFPALMRASEPDGFEARVVGPLFGWLFVAPLFMYLLAALSHVLARLVGGQGTWFGARLALFWSLLAAAPLWLINGFVAEFSGATYLTSIVAGLALGMFVVIWISSLIEAESGATQSEV